MLTHASPHNRSRPLLTSDPFVHPSHMRGGVGHGRQVLETRVQQVVPVLQGLQPLRCLCPAWKHRCSCQPGPSTPPTRPPAQPPGTFGPPGRPSIASSRPLNPLLTSPPPPPGVLLKAVLLHSGTPMAQFNGAACGCGTPSVTLAAPPDAIQVRSGLEECVCGPLATVSPV